MSEDDILRLWLYLQALWPAFEIPDNPAFCSIKAQAWLGALGDLDLELCGAATVQYGRTAAGKAFPPNPLQLRECAESLARVASGSPDVPDVQEAWAEVRAAIGRVGSRGSPVWSHPAISAAVAAMGWRDLCMSESPGVDRGQFIKLYGATQSRFERDQRVAPPALSAWLGEAAKAIGRPGALELER